MHLMTTFDNGLGFPILSVLGVNFDSRLGNLIEESHLDHCIAESQTHSVVIDAEGELEGPSAYMSFPDTSPPSNILDCTKPPLASSLRILSRNGN